MASSVQSTARTTPTRASDAPARADSASATQKHTKTSAPPATSVPKDTVKVSNAAQNALQESQETHAQTAKEAASGDRQVAQLQAKEFKTK